MPMLLLEASPRFGCQPELSGPVLILRWSFAKPSFDLRVLQYGGEYVLVGLGAAASSLRPRAQLNVRLNDDWSTAFIFASMPNGPGPLEANDAQPGGALAAALNELDAFPALLWRQGRPVFQKGLHEEISAERKFGTRGKLQIAGFHD